MKQFKNSCTFFIGMKTVMLHNGHINRQQNYRESAVVTPNIMPGKMR